MGPPVCCRLQAFMPTMSSKQEPRQSGLPLSATDMCPHVAGHFNILHHQASKLSDGAPYHTYMPSLCRPGPAKPAQLLHRPGISASPGVLPACRG